MMKTLTLSVSQTGLTFIKAQGASGNMDAKAAKIGPQPKDVFQQIFPHLINNEFWENCPGFGLLKDHVSIYMIISNLLCLRQCPR